MKLQITILALFLFVGCQTKIEENPKSENPKIMQENTAQSFFVGTYTDGESKGIYKYLLEKDGTLKQIGLVAESDNPSFLTKSVDGNYLVAINEMKYENGEGTVESYLITNDSLEFLSRSTSGGAHPCFVAINESGFVLAANYTGGNVGLLKLSSSGKLSDLLDLQQHTGKGTTKRQQAPHAHSVWFAPSGNDVISIDLGTNELWLSQLNAETQKLIPSEPNKFMMEAGTGPRHLEFHANEKWIYVVNELTSSVTLLQKNETERYVNKKTISTLPADYSEPNTCADIHISSDGKFLYASNRGHNSIAIFEVNSSDGSLKLITHEPTRGDGPRNFSLSPDEDYLLVANQKTNNILSFKRDEKTGLLSFVSEIEAFMPVCILF